MSLLPMDTGFDPIGAQEKLKRRQAVIDSMMQQSMANQSPQYVSNSYGTFYAGPTGLGQLGRLVGGFGAMKAQEGVDKDQSDFRGQYRTWLADAVQRYSELAKTDPRMAATSAVASPYPEVQALGAAAMKTLDAGAIQPKDLLPYANPEAIPKLASGGVGAFQAKPEITAKDLLPYASPDGIVSMTQGGTGAFVPKRNLGEIDGMVYDKDNQNVVTLGGPKPTTLTQNGDLYQQSPSTGALKKLDNAPKVTVGGPSVTVTSGQKKGVEEYFKHASAQVDELGKQADSAQRLTNTLNQLRQLHQAGINSNVTSDMKTAAQNLGQSLGLNVDAAKLGNTETYNSLITDLWQRAVAQYGGNRGVTAQEAEQIKKLTPLASSSPQAREQLFDIMGKAAGRQIQAYRQANQSFAKAAAADDPTLFQIPDYMEQVYAPPAQNPSQVQPSTQPMTLEDYLRKNGGR